MTQDYNECASTPPSSLKSIKACLDHLEEEAKSQGLALTANLIEAASQAVAEKISERHILASYGKQHTNLKPKHS